MLAVWALCLLGASAGSPAEVPKVDNGLRFRLQVILDKGTVKGLGMGLQLGLSTETASLELASGFSYFNPREPSEHQRARPSDVFLYGSTAKMYTAAAILRLVQAGRFGLDDPALPLMDPLYRTLERADNQSLSSVFGPRIGNVTVRQLLSMRAGFPDFDDFPSRRYQLSHPEEDLGPVQELSFVPHPDAENSCAPGSCGQYSSTNYELLGLILAQAAGARSWDDYNQSAALPPALLARMPHTRFGVHGTCKDYGTVHGITIDGLPKELPADVFNMSCTNGWTCGNLLSNAGDAARFVKALLGPGDHVLSTEVQQEMLTCRPLTQGWSTGLRYGLGVMDLSEQFGLPDGSFLGHGGATYGFLSFTGYLADLGLGFSIVGNTENPVIANVAKQAVHAIRQHFAPVVESILI